MATSKSYVSTRRSMDYSSDSSVLSYDYCHHMKRIERPECWRGLSSLCHTSSESLDSLCHQCQKQNLGRLAVMQRWLKGRSDRSHTKWMHQTNTRRDIRSIWVTEVLSGTGFYAMTKQDKEKADELKAILAAQLGDSPTMVERVVPKMVCALKVHGSWERVEVRSQCIGSCCVLRGNSEEQPSPQEYWHVFLMDVGSKMCVSLSQLALVTRVIASKTQKTRLYYLRRIYLKDGNSDEAMAFLKSKIMNNQWLTAEVFYHPSGRGCTRAEIVMGNTFLSDVMVQASFASYYGSDKYDQRRKLSDASACCSIEDKEQNSSKNNILCQVALQPQQNIKPDVMNNSLPELMNLIDHLMRQRKESVSLTSSESALNLAIKSYNREKVLQHQGLYQHAYASLNKYQILLRRLQNENPYIHEIRDLRESLFEKLIEMFEKWRVSYKNAQKKSDIIINKIGNIFISFANNSGLGEYKHHCKTMDTLLSNEILLQNDGQELAQMIVPAVATKLMCSIAKLEFCAKGLLHAADRPHTLHQFISRNQDITPLTLETLSKDKCMAEVEERSLYQPSESETGECTSELDSILQPYIMETSGNETTDSEAFNSTLPSVASTERESKKTQLPTTAAESPNLASTEREVEETLPPCAPVEASSSDPYNLSSKERESKDIPLPSAMASASS